MQQILEILQLPFFLGTIQIIHGIALALELVRLIQRDTPCCHATSDSANINPAHQTSSGL